MKAVWIPALTLPLSLAACADVKVHLLFFVESGNQPGRSIVSRSCVDEEDGGASRAVAKLHE